MKLKILALLIEAIKLYPDLRVGQIMVIAAIKGGYKNNEDIFYCPNETILNGLKIFCEQEKRRRKANEI